MPYIGVLSSQCLVALEAIRPSSCASHEKMADCWLLTAVAGLTPGRLRCAGQIRTPFKSKPQMAFMLEFGESDFCSPFCSSLEKQSDKLQRGKLPVSSSRMYLTKSFLRTRMRMVAKKPVSRSTVTHELMMENQWICVTRSA